MYRAFGLLIDSELDLPELADDRTGGEPDVVIALHHDSAPAEPREGYWFTPEDLAFRIRDGDRIDIWAPAGTAREDVSIWLLGTVMAALLHQRGRLTVHANCLETPAGMTIAFAGDSGAGKSSLAAMAAAAGWAVLGDDLLALDGDGAVHPGVLRLKLWRQDLALLKMKPDGLRKVASDLDKFHVPLAPVHDGARKLRRIYTLERGALGFERLEGVAAARALLANLYRFGVGQEVRGGTGDQFTETLALADKLEIWRFSRPDDRDGLADQFAALAAHLDG